MSCSFFQNFVRTVVKFNTKTTWLDKVRVDVLKFKFEVVSRERNRSKC